MPTLFWSIGYRTTDDGAIYWFLECSRCKDLDIETERARKVEYGWEHVEANRKPPNSNAATFNRPGELLVCTRGERNNFSFRQDFAALDALRQELLQVLFPGLAAKLADPAADFSTIKAVDLLWSAALLRLHRLDLSKPCPRCGGSGEYSYNLMYGTTCFKCGAAGGRPGRGWIPQNITKKLVKEATRRMALAQFDESGRITGWSEPAAVTKEAQ